MRRGKSTNMGRAGLGVMAILVVLAVWISDTFRLSTTDRLGVLVSDTVRVLDPAVVVRGAGVVVARPRGTLVRADLG